MKKVFEAHKKANKIYVVGKVPFLEKKHAFNFAKGDESKIKEVPRDEAMKEKDKDVDPKKEELKVLKATAKKLKISGYGKMLAEELKEAIAKHPDTTKVD